ncbi:MAG: universal stress protein [Verrucomicrobia bacterium]|nr:universal stress protein [Verrucomicrobiota bacterium]
MKGNLKLLVAYDGSQCAGAALNDLKRAGLPREVEALVVSVADVWLPPPGSEIAAVAEMVPPPVRLSRAHAIETEEQALALAEQAAARLRERFPGWQISVAACHDTPWTGILKQAEEFKPGLIVVGSHGRSALGRMVLGSVSQRVATEASCSVRLARGLFAEDVAPPRIVVGVDGSEHSNLTVSRVAERVWPPGTAVHVVAFTDVVSVVMLSSEYPPVSGLMPEDYDKEEAQLREFATAAVGKLHAAGLLAAPIVRRGDPRREILHEAERWGADCVFVGAQGHTRPRIILGSVSQWVASRAHCSVELVRA